MALNLHVPDHAARAALAAAFAAATLLAGCGREERTDGVGMAPNTPAASSPALPGDAAPASGAATTLPDTPANSTTGGRVGVPQGSPEPGGRTPENTPRSGADPGAVASPPPTDAPASGTR